MAAEAAAPAIAETEVDRLFRLLEDARAIGLAVSGGPDSMALMLLAARWRARHADRPRVVVFTVDHGLRPDSPAEARFVEGEAKRLGLEHETLVWKGPKPDANLQEAAREARYRLLTGRCRALGLGHLATAHHLDDQAETFLLRLARGSGVDGLSAMAPESPLADGTVLVRPLLDVPKARLVATLAAAGFGHVEDPSNASPRFARARIRKLMPMLAPEGMTAERLAATARRMARARAALEASAGELHRTAVRADPAGFCRLDCAELAAAPEEIGLRLLARLLMGVAGSDLLPRLDRLERLYGQIAAFSHGEVFRGATLAGCRVMPADGDVIVCREAGRAPLPALEMRPGRTVLWDGRFRVRVASRLGRRAVVRQLGTEGLRALRTRSAVRPIPAAAARASAAVFVGEDLFAAPHIEATPGPFSPSGVEIAFVGGNRLQ